VLYVLGRLFDHHHGCPVDQHGNICTTHWHDTLSLFHYRHLHQLAMHFGERNTFLLF
jgi:hypothetical protein